MVTEIKSPTYPESVADGTIANWVKKEGQEVKQDEPSRCMSRRSGSGKTL